LISSLLGKTFLYNTLIAWAKSQKKTFKACASTGIAATLLINGATVHSSFWVPINIKKDSKPKIDAQKEYAQKIRDAAFIIIDEVSMLHTDVLSYVDRLLRDIAPEGQRHIPFGGKVVILGGDWKQLMPVEEGAGELGQIAASIHESPLFRNNFKTLRLRENMRVKPGQKEFVEQLDAIGNGRNFEKDKNGDPTPYISVHKQNLATSLDELIRWTFPERALKNPLKYATELCGNAILCPTNDAVFRINDYILKKLEGIERVYKSNDTVDADSKDSHSQYAADQCLESINHQIPSGMPPHVLKLKEGSSVMLIRNLDIQQGLCNGTRLQIVKMYDNFLKCRILTGSRDADETVLIPKVRFEYGKKEGELGVKWSRIQYPIRPAFAMTINKAQGQTLKKMGLALIEEQVIFWR
jgi:hypothetical protein